MSSGLDFGALSLGGARFVPCGSSSQLYRGRTGLCPALFLTGISQSELAIRKSYHGEQSGVHRAGGIGIWAGDLCWIVCEFEFS